MNLVHKVTIVFAAVVVIVLVGAVAYLLAGTNIHSAQQQQTMAGWVTYADPNGQFSYQYPSVFGAHVWQAQFWPPKVTVSASTAMQTVCPDMSNASGNLVQATVKLGMTQFTKYTASDAGAGQLYTWYCYVTTNKQKTYGVEFVIHSHIGCQQGQCGAYCATQYEQECRNFDLQRDVATPVQEIVSTFTFL